MYSLTGCFVRDDLQELLTPKQIMYPFTLIFGEFKLKLYAIKQEEKDEWLKVLRDLLKYSSLIDFFDIREAIGKGKFGVVRAGVSKQNGKNVAVKFIKKANLASEDTGLIRKEIEILKMCQHPNIIMMDDIFENTEYIFIVMELMRGGDLSNFIKKNKHTISEARACGIMHALASALYYLHSHGIIHRDIKPDNIVMIDESEDSDIKIVDFGLSRFIGPSEKCLEPFGTYGYAAPEVLKGMPYDKCVDVWSLGVVTYMMLWGTNPFIAGDEDETARRTICEEPNYEPLIKVSKKAKDCVTKMLIKDPNKRITLKELLVHPWVNKHFPNVVKMRQSSHAENEFRVYSLVNPTSVKIFDEVKKRSDEVSKHTP